MRKELNELSLEELWELFPITLKPYDEAYPLWYQEEAENLKNFLDDEMVSMHHIGSTAIPGLIAKPIIDILLEVKEGIAMDSFRKKIVAHGWILMSQQDEPLKDVYNKGYTKDGYAKKVYHLHVRTIGDYDELYFRDYLIHHQNAREEYAQLKTNLAHSFRHHRDRYTSEKTDFVMDIVKKARKVEE